jgi:hypothetical protein
MPIVAHILTLSICKLRGLVRHSRERLPLAYALKLLDMRLRVWNSFSLMVSREVKHRFLLRVHFIIIAFIPLKLLVYLSDILFTFIHRVWVAIFSIIVKVFLLFEELWFLVGLLWPCSLPTFLDWWSKTMNRSIVTIVVGLWHNRWHGHVIVAWIQELVVSMIRVLVTHCLGIFWGEVCSSCIHICMA